MDSANESHFYMDKHSSKHPSQPTTDHYFLNKTKNNEICANGGMMMLADRVIGKDKKGEDSCLTEDSVSNSSNHVEENDYTQC